MRTGSTRPRCSGSRASSTCRRRCSSCRRQTARTRRACASSRPGVNCPLPAIRRWAPRSRWPPSTAWSRRCRRPAGAGRDRSAMCAAPSPAGRGAPFAEFDLPRLPEPVPLAASREAVAAALGLGFHTRSASRTTRSAPGRRACPMFACRSPGSRRRRAPRSTPANGRRSSPPRTAPVGDAYVYCRETVGHDCDFHARMFAPDAGIAEDPATGSAAAAFAGAVMHFDQPRDGVDAMRDRAGRGDGTALAHPPRNGGGAVGGWRRRGSAAMPSGSPRAC